MYYDMIGNFGRLRELLLYVRTCKDALYMYTYITSKKNLVLEVQDKTCEETKLPIYTHLNVVVVVFLVTTSSAWREVGEAIAGTTHRLKHV